MWIVLVDEYNSTGQNSGLDERSSLQVAVEVKLEACFEMAFVVGCLSASVTASHSADVQAIRPLLVEGRSQMQDVDQVAVAVVAVVVLAVADVSPIARMLVVKEHH